MKIYYEESDLVSFANYVLSQERTDLISTPSPNSSIPIEDQLKEVYHADLENWKEKQKNEKKIFYFSEQEVVNDILEKVGIKTIKTSDQVFWEYNDKKVVRTNQPDWIGFIKREFEIDIRLMYGN